MGVNSLPKTVARQRRDCDLNPGPSVPEFSTLTTRLPSHSYYCLHILKVVTRNFATLRRVAKCVYTVYCMYTLSLIHI